MEALYPMNPSPIRFGFRGKLAAAYQAANLGSLVHSNLRCRRQVVIRLLYVVRAYDTGSYGSDQGYQFLDAPSSLLHY